MNPLSLHAKVVAVDDAEGNADLMCRERASALGACADPPGCQRSGRGVAALREIAHVRAHLPARTDA